MDRAAHRPVRHLGAALFGGVPDRAGPRRSGRGDRANPALGLIFGPAFDLTTVDGFNAWRSLALGGFLAALGAIFTVTRASRGQEDSGRAELLASGVLGRQSLLLTSCAMAFIGMLALGVVCSVVTILCGGDPRSSVLLAATFTATGWMFASVAAVTAQLGSDARTSNFPCGGHPRGAVPAARLRVFDRGTVVDCVDQPARVGVTESRPASGNHWWPLLLALGLSLGLLGAAFALQSRRDFGQGAIAPKPGPARGGDRSTWRLALRLNRGPLITWAVAFAMLGVVFGFFTTSITDILGSDSTVQRVLASGAVSGADLVSAFLVTILSLIGILAAVPGVQVMLKVRTEELEDHVGPIMATAVPRSRYYASNVLPALVAPTCYLLLAGTLVALLASRADIGIRFGGALGQAVATVPAVWTVVAVSVAGGRRAADRQHRRLARGARLVRPHTARSHLRAVRLGLGHQPVLAHTQHLGRRSRLQRAGVDHAVHLAAHGGRVRRIPSTRPRALTHQGSGTDPSDRRRSASGASI